MQPSEHCLQLSSYLWVELCTLCVVYEQILVMHSAPRMVVGLGSSGGTLVPQVYLNPYTLEICRLFTLMVLPYSLLVVNNDTYMLQPLVLCMYVYILPVGRVVLVLLLPWPAAIAVYTLSDVCGYIHMYICVPQYVLGKAHIQSRT